MSFIKNLLLKIISIPLRTGKAGLEIKESFDSTKVLRNAKALVKNKNRAWLTNCTQSSDLQWVAPNSFDLLWANKHSLILEPEKEQLFICYVENPETLHPLDEPEMDVIEKEKMVEQRVKGSNKIIQTYEIDKQSIKGGAIISRVAHMIVNTAILKFMEAKSKRELLLIILAVLFIGIVIGIVMGVIILVTLLSLLGA